MAGEDAMKEKEDEEEEDSGGEEGRRGSRMIERGKKNMQRGG